MIETDRNRQDQWYSNQKLFEMFMEKIESLQGQQNKLILDLELTRKDLRQYNNLREQLQALHERQDSMEARCVYDMTNPDSPINKLSQKVDNSLSDVKTSVDINAAAGLWVYGTIYLTDLTDASPTIRALTSGNRYGLLIRADTAGNSASINLYGENDGSYPGAMILRSGGQATLYLYPDGNARFYGDLRMDGNLRVNGTITSPTTIELTQNTRVTGWLQPKANNTYSLGGGSSRWSRIFLQYNPDVAFDIRLKSSIQNIPNGLLGELKEIQPKMYKQGEKWHFGYIAQDVERALYKYALKEVGWDKAKDYVREFDVLYKDESYLSLVYAEIAVLKEAEMQARIDELESKVEQLLQ